MARPPLNPLTLQLLEWAAERPRTYVQAMEAWRTSCPRQSIWEDAVKDGLIQVLDKGATMDESTVALTDLGRAQLEPRDRSGDVLPLVVVQQLYAYNYWARDRQLQACAALTPEQFRRPLGNSFSSIEETLTHLLVAEWLWHERLRGRSPRTVPGVAEFPTLAALTERLHIIERDMREYLAGLNEEALGSPLTYTNSRGEQWTYPRWRVLLHLVNHQTYHRGQVTTLLRQLGVLPEPVDLLVADDMGLFNGRP